MALRISSVEGLLSMGGREVFLRPAGPKGFFLEEEKSPVTSCGGSYWTKVSRGGPSIITIGDITAVLSKALVVSTAFQMPLLFRN